MAEVHYEIVAHDGGWAYKFGDVFSETFATRRQASDAARAAVARQTLSRETTEIQYQDEHGVWHEEMARDGQAPAARVIE